MVGSDHTRPARGRLPTCSQLSIEISRMPKVIFRPTGNSGLLTMLRSSFAQFCCTPRAIGQKRVSPHYRTLAALPLILGERHKDDANYLDTCRTKRNTAEYDRAGVTTQEDAGELIGFVRELRAEVIDWLRKNHPKLLH